MSANRANIDWHLMNMIGGRPIPEDGGSGYAPGAIAIKSKGSVANGLYINRGTKDSCEFVSTDGCSAIKAGGVEQGTETASATQNYKVGCRMKSEDGSRVYRYAKADGDGAISYYGCSQTLTDVLGWTAPPVAQDAGDSEIYITLAGREKNDLAGGYIFIHYSVMGNAMDRYITGNDASSGGRTKLYLDRPLTYAITAATGATEVWGNPYSAVTQTAADVVQSVMGVPAATMAANYYGWIQTWGPCVVSPGEDITTAVGNNNREVVFKENCLFKRASFESAQLAGFIINRGSAGIAGPLIMLMISP